LKNELILRYQFLSLQEQEEKMLKKLLLLSFIILLPFSASFAQDEDVTTDNKLYWEWEKYFWEKDTYKMPTISLNYGFSQMNLNGFSSPLADPNLVELKLGFTTEKDFDESENVVSYNFQFFQLSNFSTDLSNMSSNNSKLKTEMWRFSFGRAKGYGYDFNSAAILPYYSYSLSWSRLNVRDSITNSIDKERADLYNEVFRFGTNTEAGIRFKIFSPLVLEASYERSIIFQRHLFWKWAGSVLIEAGGQWMLDEFIEEIMESSPAAGPIVNFVLKNALSYGMYELRQEKMNWPFKSAAPLAYDQFKFGISFLF